MIAFHVHAGVLRGKLGGPPDQITMIMTTRFRLYKALGYITSAPRGVEFSPRQPQPRNLLFMFPLQKEHIEASRFLFKKLMQHVKRDLIRAA